MTVLKHLHSQRSEELSLPGAQRMTPTRTKLLRLDFLVFRVAAIQGL